MGRRPTRKRPPKQNRRSAKLRRAAFFITFAILMGVCAAVFIVVHSFTDSSQNTTPQSSDTQNQTAGNPTEPSTINSSAPKHLSIPALAISEAQVVPVDKEPSGEMEAPKDFQHVGWYKHGAKPGDGRGAILLNGHYGAAREVAIFQYLDKLSSGDTIELEDEAGQKASYKIYHVEQVPLEQLDMRKMMFSADPSREGLNIITCGGDFDRERDTYNDRVVVYAVRMD